MEKKYNLSYDLLGIIACFMVVVFHCNGVFYNFSDSLSWKISAAVRCIVYSAIPIFFMLTGAKLFGYRERYSTKEFAKKRIKTVLVPFLFWNGFYIIFPVLTMGKLMFSSAREFISMFLNSDFNGRFWFFWPLFAIYAAIPVLSLMLSNNEHRKYLWYTVAVTFALLWVIRPLLIMIGVEYNSSIQFPIAADYMMLPILGHLISTCEIPKKLRIIIYAAAILSSMFAFLYTVIISASKGGTVQTAVSYKFFPSTLMGLAIFIFIKHRKLTFLEKRPKAVRLIRTVSGCGMGIWLSHSLAITVLQKLTGLTDSSYIWRFVFPFVIFGLCAFGVWIIKKIPFLRRIV